MAPTQSTFNSPSKSAVNDASINFSFDNFNPLETRCLIALLKADYNSHSALFYSPRLCLPSIWSEFLLCCPPSLVNLNDVRQFSTENLPKNNFYGFDASTHSNWIDSCLEDHENAPRLITHPVEIKVLTPAILSSNFSRVRRHLLAHWTFAGKNFGHSESQIMSFLHKSPTIRPQIATINNKNFGEYFMKQVDGAAEGNKIG